METSNDIGDDNNNNSCTNGKSPSDTYNTNRWESPIICTAHEENKETSSKIKGMSVDNTPSSSPEIPHDYKGDVSKQDKVQEEDKLPFDAETIKQIGNDIKEEITDAGENDVLVTAKRNLKKIDKPQNGYDTRHTDQDFSTSEEDKKWNKKKHSDSDKTHEGKKISPPKNVKPIIAGIISLGKIRILCD